MKRLLIVSLLAVGVALPAQADAGIPCRNKIFNDWNADGKVASTYPHACYVDALHNVPPDAGVYSSLRDDIAAAMRAAERQLQGQAVPKQVGHGFAPHNVLANAHSNANTSTTKAPHDPAPAHVDPAKEPTSVKSSSGAPVASSSSSGAPLPVVLLGGLALALVAAGAVGAGVRRARSRRS